MPAPPYEGWHHLRIEGDRDEANALRHLGRKVLGYAVQQAGFNNLPTFKHTLELPNGGSITGELRGGIPRTTIRTGSKPPGKQIRVLDGFFFARRNGEDPERTAAMLTAPLDADEGDDWRALFFSSEAEGYDLAPEERRGGYADVFGGKAKKPWQRLETGGGVWMDRDTKEAVTWWRGYLGYWPHHYRHPVTNYAYFVSIYGHLVYTVPFEEWRVLAAAKRGQFLYVMIAEDLGHLSPPERPSTASESGQIWFSEPFTDTPYTYSLWRYPLSVVTQKDTLIDTYKAGRHELADLLWQGELELAYGAWSFNADCTSVVTVTLPRRCKIDFHVYLDEAAHLWRSSSAPSPDYPEVEAQRIELTIEHSGEVPTATLAQELAPITIAEEDGVKLNLVLAERTGDPDHDNITIYSRMEYQCGDFAVAAIDGTTGANPADQYQTTRDVYYAHLPSKTFLFLKRYLGPGVLRQVVIEYELYVNGELVPITDDPLKVDTTLGVAPAPIDSAFAELRLAVPWMGVYAPDYSWSLLVEFDSMTFLYGFSFFRRNTGDALPGGGPNSQAYFVPSLPYVPYTGRASTDSPYVQGGAVGRGAGAGGWSVATHGGPGPTFVWDDFNDLAPATYFNRGLYLDPDPSVAPFPSGFGDGVLTFDGEVVIAIKGDPWGAFPIDSPYPMGDALYPLRYATNGDARPLIDAIDPRLSTAGTIYYGNYQLGHTGMPMRRQKTRFDP